MESAATIEQLKCPICFEIPPGEIVQCRNGHTLCSQCRRSLEDCPICRVRYGSEEIRNRQMEFMLDVMTFPCLNKDEGCAELLQRKNILQHYKTCKFTEKSFNVCKLMGYQCSFKIKSFQSTQLETLETHMKSNHGWLAYPGSEVQLLQLYQQPSPKFWTFIRDMVWDPVILHSNSGKMFLLFSKINGTNKTVSWTCLLLDDGYGSNDLKYNLELSIQSSKQGIQDLSWRQQCVTYMEAETVHSSRLHQMPLDFLMENYLECDCLKVNVSIAKDSDQRPSSKKEFEVLTILCSPVEFYFESEMEEPVAGNGGLMFTSHTCDICCKKSVQSPLFVCLQCTDFVLCSNCFSPAIHAFHVFGLIRTQVHMDIYRRVSEMYKKSVLPFGKMNPEVHNWIKGNNCAVFEAECDGCESDPIVGTRFKCLQCEDYDLCEACIAAGVHSHHLFAIVTNFHQNNFIADLEKIN